MSEIRNLLRAIVAILVIAGAIAVWAIWLGPASSVANCRDDALKITDARASVAALADCER